MFQASCSFARIIVVIFAFALSVPVTAQHNEPVAQSTRIPISIPINIGYPQTNYWSLLVARDLKLFEQVGLNPSFHVFTSGAPLIAGMRNGSVDVAWTGLATLFMLGNKIPLKIVLVHVDHSSQMTMLVSKKSGIKTFKDLKSSSIIGAPSGTCAEVSAVLAAKKAGLSTSSLKISNLAPNLLLGSLQNDQIDAAFIWAPWNFKLRDAGFTVAGGDKDYVPGGSVCAATVAIRTEFLTQNPSVGCRLIKVHALALEAVRKNPELAISTIQKELKLSYQMAKESFETLGLPSLASQLDPHSQWSLTNANNGLSKKLLIAADALYEAKSFSEPLSKAEIAQAVDARYVKQYLETNCQ